ncbi:MAG: tRNA-dihydrouridine synthase [Deltaproteobacteria bacterium]|nr:tRNA-dihydrouridine synthase [Deltaproteobacteria bacterium]
MAIDINSPLKIGSVTTKGPRLILAPMSGVTNSAFRRLLRRENPNGLGHVVTEFISIEGLTRANAQSVRMLAFAPEERTISIQIFGYDVDRMRDAALMAQDSGAEIVDINSGCPVPKVVRRGGGCELMRQPIHMAQMLTAVRAAVKIPLTLKIRSGWDDACRNGIEIAKIAEDCGVDMLAVHGRTRTQLYRGESDWDFIGRVASSVKIPVVGSGDVVDVASAKDKLERSGVAALMIGRGALQKPWIFEEIHAGMTGRTFVPPSPARLFELFGEYRDLLLEQMPEKGAIGKLKQLASQATRSFPGSAFARKALVQSSSISHFSELLKFYRDGLQEGQFNVEGEPGLQSV